MKECCWLPYLEMCKLCIQDLGLILYVAVMLPRFYKILSGEKEKKKFIRVFSKQHGFASQDFLVIGSNGWGFCGVADTPAVIRGGGVTSYPCETLENRIGRICCSDS